MAEEENFRFLNNRNDLSIAKCEILYNSDSSFHCLTKSLEGLIEQLHLSPSEIRAAAMYACYIVELRRAPPGPIY